MGLLKYIVLSGWRLTWSFHNPDSLTRDTLNDIAWTFSETFSVPSFAPVPSSDFAILIELHSMLLCFGI